MQTVLLIRIDFKFVMQHHIASLNIRQGIIGTHRIVSSRVFMYTAAKTCVRACGCTCLYVTINLKELINE